VAHQGSEANGQLWHDALEGPDWAGDAPVPNVGMSDSPSAVVFNGLLYVFHQGDQNDGQLWYASFDGEKWAEDQQVPALGMSASPGAAAWIGVTLP
jgi:hypothetical protein